MLFPVRCPSCNMEISSKAKLIIDYRLNEKGKIKDLTKIYDQVGLYKYCCRMQINVENVRASILPQK